MLDQLTLFADAPIEETLTPLPDPLPGEDDGGSPPAPFGFSGTPGSPRDFLHALYKQAQQTNNPQLIEEFRVRLADATSVDWDEAEYYHTQVMEAQADAERAFPNYKQARPEDSPEIVALRLAFHRFELAGYRWHQHRTEGLSDKALRAALAEELGPYGGFEGHGVVVRYKGGTTPTVWVGPEEEVRILRGDVLLQAAREILDLPYPGQSPLQASVAAPAVGITMVVTDDDDEDADDEVPIERAVLPPDPDDNVPELRLGPEAAKALTDDTPRLLEEVRTCADFLDLRWWPAGNQYAPVEKFEGPTRARSVIFTLKKRHVGEEEIRAALDANWQHNGPIELATQYEYLATGEYANRAADLLSAIAPAFNEPCAPGAYWDRHQGEAAGWQQEVAALLDEADHRWAAYSQLAEVLGLSVDPLPAWVVTLAKLLPYLEAFELAHPCPEAPSPRRKGRGAPTETYLVSRGAEARYVLATGPEPAAVRALQDGLGGTHPWLIVRHVRRGEHLMSVECPVATILSVSDLIGSPATPTDDPLDEASIAPAYSATQDTPEPITLEAVLPMPEITPPEVTEPEGLAAPPERIPSTGLDAPGPADPEPSELVLIGAPAERKVSARPRKAARRNPTHAPTPEATGRSPD